MLNENLAIRHLQQNDRWTCGEVETIQHFLEECNQYAAPRQHIKTILSEKGLARYPLIDVCQYEENFCHPLRWAGAKTKTRIDNVIKDYV